MNKNLYHWHDEQMVKHEMQEVRRAAEQARLLKEAGLAGTSMLSRIANLLRNLLNARRKRVRDHRSLEHEAFGN